MKITPKINILNTTQKLNYKAKAAEAAKDFFDCKSKIEHKITEQSFLNFSLPKSLRTRIETIFYGNTKKSNSKSFLKVNID